MDSSTNSNFVDGKYYTTSYFLMVSYDKISGGCKAPAIPSRLSTNIINIGATDTCPASTSCTNGPDSFIGTMCSSPSTYHNDVSTTFGLTPFIIMEKYAAGKSCDVAALKAITTYVADGKCHTTGAGESFRFFTADDTVTIQTYLNSAICVGAPVTIALPTYSSGQTSCITAYGIVDLRVTSEGAPMLYLSSTTPATKAVLYQCRSQPLFYRQIHAKRTTYAYQTRQLNNIQNSLRHKSVIYYSHRQNVRLDCVRDRREVRGRQELRRVDALGYTTYVADGKCHKSGSTASFRTTRKTDGSATIVTFTTNTASCSTSGTTLSVTSDQALGNSCSADSKGVLNTKINISA
ncbi:unnamed protein product [Phytophthora lilii]|uniref:Unnamed protein product n=1 Tax=Phytophthora lilii TaxID=2077276 RepID=A0A9W6U1V5_9STRA|nr:unnamed protein product [Phytophthora lilii]